MTNDVVGLILMFLRPAERVQLPYLLNLKFRTTFQNRAASLHLLLLDLPLHRQCRKYLLGLCLS